MDLAGTPQHIAALAILQGYSEKKIWDKKLEEVAPRYPRLNNIFSPSNISKFSDENKHPSGRVLTKQIIEAEHNRSWILSDLIRISTNRLIAPFEEGNPPWEIYILYSLAENLSTIMFRLHHALGDGISGLSFFHEMLASGKKTEFNTHHKQFIKGPHKVPLLPSISTLIREATQKNELRNYNTINSKERRLLVYSFTNHKFKEQKKKFNCTILALQLAVIANSLNIYLTKINKTPNKIRLLVPVSLRGKSRPEDFENEIGGASITVPLSVTNEDSLIPQLRDFIDKTLTKRAYGAYHLTARIFSLLPVSLRIIACKLAAKKIDAISTSLQLPAILKSQSGENNNLSQETPRIIAEFAIPALMPSHGLGFGWIKQFDKTNLAIIVDPLIIESIEILDQSFYEILSNLDPSVTRWHQPCTSSNVV
ncbi:MAG TPA: wax ester/triacylglycerol synthase family O-acyltransferase [Oligoflexia bacterium]|nr:wax ester/triacylglycerol synthase family O-acyltransferase [Oligoflexia bacterium]